MRPIKEATAAVGQEPADTIVLMPFKIVGYHKDCDGSLLACLAAVDKDGKTTGWCPDGIGLSPDTGLVVSRVELNELFKTQWLVDFLVEYGWDEDKANEVHEAYLKGGIEAGVEATKDFDDPDHSYSGEMRECILRWQRENNEQ